MSNIQDVIAKIQKLLALADLGRSNTTSAEAESAAARAAALMLEYNIQEAQLLSVSAEEDEPVVSGLCVENSARQSTWKLQIAVGLAASLGCKIYTSDGRTMLVGRKSDQEAITYLLGYITRQAAGSSIHLGGGAKAALGAPKSSLKG